MHRDVFQNRLSAMLRREYTPSLFLTEPCQAAQSTSSQIGSQTQERQPVRTADHVALFKTDRKETI